MTAPKHGTSQDTEPFSGLQAGRLTNLVAFHLQQFQIALSKYTDMAAGGIDLDRSSIRLLTLVEANPDAPQGRIAKAMNLQRSSIVTVIDRLEEAGYLERRPSASDARSKGLRLSRKGNQMVTRIRKLASQTEAEVVLSGFTSEEKEMLISLMRRATNNLLDQLTKQRA